jgi:hypothetical protein
MKTSTPLIALALAVAINTAALASLHQAMADGTQRAQLAQIEPARVMVSAKKIHTEVVKANGVGSRS